MAKSEATQNAPRESDNPMFEEYQEELMMRPISTERDVDRLVRLESLTGKLLNRVESLEQKVQDMEMRRQ